MERFIVGEKVCCCCCCCCCCLLVYCCLLGDSGRLGHGYFTVHKSPKLIDGPFIGKVSFLALHSTFHSPTCVSRLLSLCLLAGGIALLFQ